VPRPRNFRTLPPGELAKLETRVPLALRRAVKVHCAKRDLAMAGWIEAAIRDALRRRSRSLSGS